jgi:hypothetical protein
MRIDPSVRHALAIGASLLLVVLIHTELLAGSDTPIETNALESRAASELPPLFSIAPGTRIDDTPPPGWSHLVLKSIPQLASGDLDSLPESAKTTATMFRSVILADVRRTRGTDSPYGLRRVGIGICLPDRGHDLVVNSETLQALGIRLSTIPKIVLGRTESEMAQARLVARTPTFAVLRSPVMLLVGGEHHRVLINYALLIDPRSGLLNTLAWWIEADPSARKPSQDLVLLQTAPLVFSCNMDVVAHRLLGEIPVSWSFAMAAMPPGRSLTMPARLRAWSVKDPTTVAESAIMERDLRGALNPLQPVQDSAVGKARLPGRPSK